MNAENFLQLLINRSEKLTYTDSVDLRTQQYVVLVCNFFKKSVERILGSHTLPGIWYLSSAKHYKSLSRITRSIREYPPEQKVIIQELLKIHSELLGEARSTIIKYNYERKHLNKERIMVGPGNLVRVIIPTAHHGHIREKDIHGAFRKIQDALGLLLLIITNKY